MLVLIVIDEEGNTLAQEPLANDALILKVSQSAHKVLADRLSKMDGRCKSCGLFVRTEELNDGKCKGVGCDTDETVGRITGLSPVAQVFELTSIAEKATKKWIEAFNRVEKPEDAPTDEAPGDLLKDW
ncbi:hypothetical protein CMI37_15680 [Candidatus Pacearchaeota archaeon]|nr:hypothetical protein [Candidatus Pacearchaeota archaeon]